MDLHAGIVALGLVGVAVTLLGYGLISSGRLSTSNVRYQLLNILGSLLLLISLTAQWNLPSFALNSAWLAIGLISLFRLQRVGSKA